jgi:hypothetical protein
MRWYRNSPFGKEFLMIRFVCTFVLLVAPAALAQEKPRKEDPEATKLLADARAARAVWEKFPGFAAQAEVNINGKVVRTPIKVDSDGKVTVEMEENAASMFLRRTMGSLVDHRMPSGSEEPTPCAFADDNAHHPLGRSIVVLNDEFHSSYQIRDRQVIVVNRTMRDAKFTITVMENAVNKEGKFLPSCYTVSYWDLQGDVLKRSQTHHNKYTRVGAFDLPSEVLIVTATPQGLEAQSIKLTNHTLGKPAE